MLSAPVSSHMQTELYQKDVYLVKESDTFPVINEKILSPENRRKAAVVSDEDGRVTGLIRSIDLINAFRTRYKNFLEEGTNNLENMTAREIMDLRKTSGHPFRYPCLSIDATIGDFLKERRKCKELKPHPSQDVVVVGKNGEFYGFFTIEDVLKAMPMYSMSMYS